MIQRAAVPSADVNATNLETGVGAPTGSATDAEADYIVLDMRSGFTKVRCHQSWFPRPSFHTGIHLARRPGSEVDSRCQVGTVTTQVV